MSARLLFVLIFSISSIVLDAQSITTVVGCTTGPGCLTGFSGDGGPATTAYNAGTAGGAFDKFGNYYFASPNGSTIRKVDISGIISTVAGNFTGGYSGDGVLATTTKIKGPTAVVLDTAGNIYISDYSNFRIRRVDVITGMISTIAGDGTGAYYGDGILATASKIWGVEDICIDKKGNLYLADHYNYHIRKIDTKGIITTIAGNGVFSSTSTGDGGPATAAGFNLIYGIAVDDTGSIYVSDYNGGKVRMIDTFGIITTVAGNGTPTYTGDAIPATSAQIAPGKLTFDLYGNLVIADFYNNRVYQVDHSGMLYTIAGNGTGTFSGDGGVATAASLYKPAGVVYDICGNLFIADDANYRVRKVTYPAVLTIPTISITGLTSYSAGATVSVTATVANAGSSYLIHWLNKGVEFTTTTVPMVTYTKTVGTDTITARVVSTASYGCYDSTTSTKHVVTTITVGTATVLPTGMAVYPNPAGNVLHVETGTALHYRLLNVVGNTLKEGTLGSGINDINTKELPQGMYLLESTNAESGARMVVRVMKE